MITMPRSTDKWLKRAKEQLGRGEFAGALESSWQAYQEATVWHPDPNGCVQALRSVAACHMAQGDYEAAYRILSFAYLCSAFDQKQQGRIAEAVAETVKSWRLYKQALAVRQQFDLLLRSQQPDEVRRFCTLFLVQARGEGEDHWFVAFARMLEAVSLAISQDAAAVEAFEAAAAIAREWGNHVQWLAINIADLRTSHCWKS